MNFLSRNFTCLKRLFKSFFRNISANAPLSLETSTVDFFISTIEISFEKCEDLFTLRDKN